MIKITCMADVTDEEVIEAYSLPLKDNLPYGAFYTSKGERVFFNRSYQPLDNPRRWVEDIVFTEFYYNDYTPHSKRKEIGRRILSGEDPRTNNLITFISH